MPWRLLHIAWLPVLLLRLTFAAPPFWLLSSLVLAAVAVIHQPASVSRLLGLAIVQLLDVAYYLPVVPNHWLLTGILSLAILGAAVAGALRGGRAGLQLGELYQTLTPPVRLSAAVFYFFTFFHKLNADFLNPEVSCAVRFFERAVSPFPALAALPGVEPVVIGATLTAELFLAVGLAVPRWRAAACLLGASFHLLLALDAPHVFYNFSAVMFAVLWVCLPASRAAWIARQLGGRFGRCHVVRFARPLRGSSGRPPLPAPIEACPGRRYATVLLLLPALVLLNGLSPYLGLKTRTAGQMYSNLNLDGAASNHFITPYSLDVGGFLADSVRIMATSDPALHTEYVQTGRRLTWSELQRHVGQHPVKELTYVRPARPNGPDGRADEDAPRKTLGRAVLEKMLIFRAVGPASAGVCDW